jgi:hypothetical protein
MEHRWGERFGVDLAVRLAMRPFSVRMGRLINLSVSGGDIEVDFDLRPLSRIQVAIALPHRYGQGTAVLAAYVTRIHKDGIGVEWCEFAPRPIVELLRSSAQHRHHLNRGLHSVRPLRDASG